jgi:hypothetical protein
MNRSRNLFLAASAGPLDPSGEFLIIDQLRFNASHIGTRKFGIAPSNEMYQRARIRSHVRKGQFTCHRHIRDGITGGCNLFKRGFR